MHHLLPDQWLDCELDAIARLAPIQWLDWPLIAGTRIVVGMKREDLLHPLLGGNKLYKLQEHLRVAQALGQPVLSFGGAWSNHIFALAAAGQSLGFPTLGVIRGERPVRPSAMLRDAQAMGMRLHFISRKEYGRKQCQTFLSELRESIGPFYAIPEGGGDLPGARGCMALGKGLSVLRRQEPFDVVCTSVGTGSTLAGLAAGLAGDASLCGFSALKGEGSLANQVALQVRQLTDQSANWCLETNYHCGGYARYSDELACFVREFEIQTKVPLDPIYTAKMMWGIARKARAGHWPAGTRVVALHSGGLQGRRGFIGQFNQSGFETGLHSKQVTA